MVGANFETLIRPDGMIIPAAEGRTDVAGVFIQFDDKADSHAVGLNGSRSAVVTQDVLVATRIGLGEEVAIVGLFGSHYGKSRNIPIVRIGNIAAMLEEPVFTKEYGYIEAYLIEARSIGGFRGAAVAV